MRGQIGRAKMEGKIGVGGDCNIGRGKTRGKIHGDEEKKKIRREKWFLMENGYNFNF